MLNKLLHGIKTYNNVFSHAEKVKLFYDLRPYLKDQSETHPGLQTTDEIHKAIYVPPIKYFTYKKCWGNFTDIDLPDFENWHVHSTRRAAVYYFHDCPGTVFKGKFGKFQIKGVANSIITFPGSLLHSAPLNKTGPRYTLAFLIDEESLGSLEILHRKFQ